MNWRRLRYLLEDAAIFALGVVVFGGCALLCLAGEWAR